MESSKLPFHYWLYAIYLTTMTKKSFSALEVQRQLGHIRHEPIWKMMHNIRSVMGLRDHEFVGVLGHAAFYKTNSDEEGGSKVKRGFGSQIQSKVLVMDKVETKQVRPKKHKKPFSFSYVKMVVVSNSSSLTIHQLFNEGTNKEAFIKTEGWNGFNKIKEVSSKQIRKVVPSKEASKVLPWILTLNSKTKRTLLGIKHKFKDYYLQNYPNEFCYKINREYFGQKLFYRQMLSALENTS